LINSIYVIPRAVLKGNSTISRYTYPAVKTAPRRISMTGAVFVAYERRREKKKGKGKVRVSDEK
jgi:hypothetical protein